MSRGEPGSSWRLHREHTEGEEHSGSKFNVFGGLGFPHPQVTLLHKLSGPRFNLILTLSTWGLPQIPQVQGSVLQVCPVPTPSPPLLTHPLSIDGATTPSLGSMHLLEQFTELRETFYLLDHQLIMNGWNSGTARWKRCLGRGTGRGLRASMPFPGCYSSMCLPAQKLSEPHPFGFYWRLHSIGTTG